MTFKDIAIDSIAGTLGGIACVLVGQPLDTVKVKLQTFPHLYRDSIECLRKTFVHEGFRHGLYAGTMPSMIANIAENSVLFAAYGFSQNFIKFARHKSSIEELSVVENATAGSLAAFFSSFSLCPTELIKCQLQAMYQTRGLHTSSAQVDRITPLQLTRQIIRRDGIAGLFRGIETTIAREMPGYFFFFGGYEAAREFLTVDGCAKRDIGIWRTMLAGSIGGIVFWTFIFPLDMIKSRIQIYGTRDNFATIVRDIWRNEGWPVFYSGLLPTLVRTVPTTAALFVTVEYSKKFLHVAL